MIDITNIPELKQDPLRYVLHTGMVNDGGLWLEFGTWTGGTLDLLSSFTENVVYGFDTFSGLDVEWEGLLINRAGINVTDVSMKCFDIGGSPPLSIKPLNYHTRNYESFEPKRSFRENVEFVVGLFEESLPPFLEKCGRDITFMHIDCDLYESTKCVLECCYPFIKKGCVIVFDELINFDGYEKYELRALHEFISKHNVDFEWIGFKEYSVAGRIT